MPEQVLSGEYEDIVNSTCRGRRHIVVL